MALEKTPESPLDCKEIKPVHPKGDQSWIFIGRTEFETEAPKLWLLDVKNCLIGKDTGAGKNWRQEEKGTIERDMVRQHHRLYGHELEQAQGVGDGQGSLACCSPWGHKESDTTKQLNWTDCWMWDIQVPYCFYIAVCFSFRFVLASIFRHFNVEYLCTYNCYTLWIGSVIVI